MLTKRETRKKHWILQMCSVSGKHGISKDDLYRKQHPDLEISYGDIYKITKEFLEKDLIISENKDGWANEVHFYKLTKSGKKELKKLKLLDSEFYKVLSLMPSEYELKYRLYNIEHLIFHSILTILFYSLTLKSFSNGYSKTGLSLLLLTFIFFPFALGYLLEILLFTLNQITTNLFGKTYFVLKKYSKGISNFIVVFLVVIGLGLGYSYSLKAFFSALGGTILALIFRRGLESAKSFRDKIEKLVIKIKDGIKVD